MTWGSVGLLLARIAAWALLAGMMLAPGLVQTMGIVWGK